MRISSHTRGISCRQHSVEEHKSAHNFSTKCFSNVVTRLHTIHCRWAIGLEFCLSLNASCNCCATHGSQALRHNVGYSSRDGHLLCKEKTKCDSWVNVPTCNIITIRYMILSNQISKQCAIFWYEYIMSIV